MSEIVSALHNGYVDFEPHILDKSRVNEAFAQVAHNQVFTGDANRNFTEREPNSSGIAYVDMNDNGFIKVTPGKEGIIATSKLSGCTGIALLSETFHGQAAAIAHYDSLSQNYLWSGKDSPIVDTMHKFRFEVGEDTPIQIAILYPESAHHDDGFGKMQGDFREWHYVDQITTTAIKFLGHNVQTLLIPYRKSEFERSVYLAAGNCEGTSGIFYNGELVDFDRRFSSGFNHSQWREPTLPSYEHSNMETIRTRESLLNNWAYLAGGQGAVMTESIQSEIVDKALFDQLMDNKVPEEQAEALSELATIQYSVRSTRNEYTAGVDGRQYRVSVESRYGDRLDSIDVMPGGIVDAKLGFMMHAITISYNDPSLEKTHATTYYCIDDLIKKNSRLHRVDYTYNNHSQELPEGESSAYVPGLSDVIDFSHNMVAFSEPPHVVSDDKCTVKTSGIRFNDAANLESLIPHLKYASQVPNKS